jgi:hypothetical protein
MGRKRSQPAVAARWTEYVKSGNAILERVVFEDYDNEDRSD